MDKLSWTHICALVLIAVALIRSLLLQLGLPVWIDWVASLAAAALILHSKYRASGIADLRPDLSVAWQRLSAWLAATGWWRLLGVGLIGMVAAILVFNAVLDEGGLATLIVGLVFALGALKLAQGGRAPVPNAGPVSPASSRALTPAESWLARLTWPRWALLSLLLLIAAGLASEVLTTTPRTPWAAARISIEAPEPPDVDESAPATQASAPDAVELEVGRHGIRITETPSDGSPGTHLEIGPGGIRIGDGAQDGTAPRVAIPELRSIPGITEPDARAIEQRIELQAQSASDKREADSHSDFDPAPLVVLALVALTIMKLLAGGKYRAEQDASAARTAADLARLEREAADARLHAMQAQIEPHFLFNTLASVDQLIQSDPQRASAVQKTLIQYLRAAIPQIRDDAQRSTLGRQIAMSRAYLEIMQVRMEERLGFDFCVPKGLVGAEFPSMMLQTLIENSIKHGLEPKTEGGHISVDADVARGKLRVQVTDTGTGLAAERHDGIGLANIHERLHLLYGDHAYCSVTANPAGGTIALIEIPYRDDSGDPDAGQGVDGSCLQP